MFGRLLYHSFWNLYDYLGTYLVLGFFSVLPLAASLLGANLVITAGAVTTAKAIVLLCLVLVCWIAETAVCAGIFYFASIAARDEAARFVHFRQGVHQGWRRFSALFSVVLVAYVILGIGSVFYLTIASRVQARIFSGLLFVLGMVLVWIGIILYLFLFSFFGALSEDSDHQGIRRMARQSFVLYVIQPSLWIGAGVLFFLIFLLACLSVVGIIMIIPVYATVACTSHEISVRYFRLLEAARAELGPDAGVKQIKRKTMELLTDEDAAIPRRGLRELIRPWEM
jgi:hypothetical protein